MLNGTLTLHDVRDVEALARRVLTDWRRTHPAAHLTPHDEEDCTAHLITTAWELSQRYDASRKWSFSKYAYRYMHARIADWYRQRFWDTRAPKPEPAISFDNTWDETDTGSGRDRLELAIAESRARNHLPTTLERLVERGDRRVARLLNETRSPADRPAPSRHPRTRLGERSAA